MANPNTIAATTITENTLLLALTTAQVSFLSNAAGSGTLVKCSELVVANYSTSQVTLLAKVYSAAALGGTGYNLIPTTTIPPNTSIVVIDETTTQTLQEDRSIGLSASIANALEATGSSKTLT